MMPGDFLPQTDLTDVLPERASSIAQLRAVLQVLAHRDVQDAEHGGPSHDDTHSIAEWLTFVSAQIDKALAERVNQDLTPNPNGGFFHPRLARQRFIKIAALAISAMESLERKGLAR